MFYVVWQVIDQDRKSAAFFTFDEAYDFLSLLPAAIFCEHKYIDSEEN